VGLVSIGTCVHSIAVWARSGSGDGGRRSIPCDRCFIGRVAMLGEMKTLTSHPHCVVNRWCCRCASFDTAREDIHMEGPVNRIPSPKPLGTRPKLVVSCTLHLAVANDTRIIAQSGVGFWKLHLPWGPRRKRLEQWKGQRKVGRRRSTLLQTQRSSY
jgi:hypothetical protein